MDLDKLKALWYDINKYGEYLENSTYHPYDKVQEFAKRLKNIIESSGEEILIDFDEYCSPEEYFDEWYAYCPPETKTGRMCFEEGIKYEQEKNKWLQKQKENERM